jgi:hypothetical protein
MRNKIVSLFTLVAFIIFTFSCYIYTTKKERGETVYTKGGKVLVLAVMKTSGEYIEFPKDLPGQIDRDTIVGTTTSLKELEIEPNLVERIKKDQEGKIIEITTKDGTTYRDMTIREEENKFICSFYEYGKISIPLSEVQLAWVKRVDPALTFLTVMGGISAGILALAVIIALTKESCPFIYSFDGESYIFDAEPYGGAICQGLKRTEWCGLEHLREVSGQYKMKITNEVNETQYTDEIKLVVVDHPKGVKVIPDVSGKIHTISQPITPIQASDGKGRDLMPYVSKNDWIFWQTRTEDKDPDRKENLKDELTFEFPRPEGAANAKLLFNGCNTLWGSQVLKRFLDLYGNKVFEWYDDVNNLGPSFHRLMNLDLREELCRLYIRVETKDGWKSKGMILGGGPFVSEDRIYSLDLRDVPGDRLKIKLTPPSAFWMINYLAVDYTEDLPIKIKEIEAIKAIDHKGQDIREILAKTDNNYLAMPETGDSAELVFESPAITDDMERSVILKASGYYDIHLEARGEHQTEIIEKIFTEPGFIVQYAFKEYLKWNEENMMKARRK